MSDTPSITGKIAAVIDATTLVLNVGSAQGVREGMLFAVVAAQQEIVDPDTGASLGPWEIVKTRLVVTHVQDVMCTARPPLLEKAPASGTLSEMMVRHSFGLYGERAEAGERRALDVVQGSASGRPSVAPIAVGDGVRSIALDLNAGGTTAPSAQTSDLPSQAYGTPSPTEAGAVTDETSTANDPTPTQAQEAQSKEAQE
ncbi:MAG: hypothetical protein HN712_20265 [Gemmatimonadetes bacterium]|jgi:hypothetical protein|nr:hypothetical protein [Gemmatimonadota bacterium]MBT6146618.1 hypothetical protein [Gemmatimonadota bacterium]MBT7862661.1 hypothetical protein [Gemmatimonadota bacterium]